MAAKTLSDLSIQGKIVLMRVDFNVPLKDGVITNDHRIIQALPSIQYVLGAGGKLVLMSHLGRPSGVGYEERYSMAPVSRHLETLLQCPVLLGPAEVAGEKTKTLVQSLPDNGVVLLENLRFRAEETLPDRIKKQGKLSEEDQDRLDRFIEELAALGDCYVNDAFGTCHRMHASMYGVPQAILQRGQMAVAGLLVEKEIRYLHDAVQHPKRPFVAILGGAKVSDKILLIERLLDMVDHILIGGAMAYTLLKAQDINVGASRIEEEAIADMAALLQRAKGRIHLPIDHVATTDFFDGQPEAIATVQIPDSLMGMDIGPLTIEHFSTILSQAQTVVWNGPLGVFERPEYAKGTHAIAEILAKITTNGVTTVIGGGDSGAAVEQMGLSSQMTHISTGGGASIEYLQGLPMPSIDILSAEN